MMKKLIYGNYQKKHKTDQIYKQIKKTSNLKKNFPVSKNGLKQFKNMQQMIKSLTKNQEVKM